MTTKDEAMKLALEALEVATTPLAKDRQEVLRAQAALREALNAPLAKQEPVAWVCEASSSDEKHAIDYWPGDVDDLPIGTKLYTSPPAQRQARSADTWVGLTNEDINVLLGQFPRYSNEWDEFDFHVFARAIEAAHGIKGDA